MNRLSLGNNWLKFKIPGNITHRLRGISGMYLKLIKETGKITICLPVGLGNTRIFTDYAQNPS
jgi:hypothetical protein